MTDKNRAPSQPGERLKTPNTACGTGQDTPAAALGSDRRRAPMTEPAPAAHGRDTGGADGARPRWTEFLLDRIAGRQDEMAQALEALTRSMDGALRDLAGQNEMILSAIQRIPDQGSGRPRQAEGATRRVGLFVDVQNMYYGARGLDARLDFGALMRSATRDRRLIKAVAYVVRNRDIDQSSFLSMLQQKNYEVRRKDLRVRQDGTSKGDWDMEIALDILQLADTLDVVVLASGDGDFTSLVVRLKTIGPLVEVYSFPGSTSKELMEAADRYVEIGEELLIHPPPAA
ncbi:MAG: NYN domain-containing protein [Acidobacteriota bacterium]